MLSQFPKGMPPADIEERLRIYEALPEATRSEIERRYYRAQNEIVTCLAAFIRSNRADYEDLLAQKSSGPAQR